MMHRISIVVWILLGIANGYTAIWTEYCPKFVDTPLANRALERGDEAVTEAVAAAHNAGSSAAGVGLAAEKAATKGLGFGADLGRNIRAAAIRTGTAAAICGGKVATDALSSLGHAVVGTVSANLAHEIGTRYAHGSGDMSWLTHKLCHFVLGGTTAELTGGDFLAGGAGAAVGEIVADAMIQRALEQTREEVREQLDAYHAEYGQLPPLQDAETLTLLTYLEHLETEQAEQIQRYGRLAAAGTAFIGHLDIETADAAAGIAIENNSIESINAQIESLGHWIRERYRVVQVWLDEHNFVSMFVPGSLWVELEGKVHRGEKLTTTDFVAAGMSFISIAGRGAKCLALKTRGKILRKGMDTGAVRIFLKDIASQKSPILRKTKIFIQNEPVYEVLKDTGCLKKGNFIRLDAAYSRTPGVNSAALPHGHIEILQRKGEKFSEIGKCVVEGTTFIFKK